MYEELIDRALALGATPGVPATEDQIDAAERRLGVRFDAEYLALMRACNGIEGIPGSDTTIYPVDELGVSQRWRERAAQLDGEYFQGEFVNPEVIEYELPPGAPVPRFHPAPPGRAHVLIAEQDLINTPLLCNFSSDDPEAPPGEIAACFWEPSLKGTLGDVLAALIAEAEELSEDDANGRSETVFAMYRLVRSAEQSTPAIARHAISADWRALFDAAPDRELSAIADLVLTAGNPPTDAQVCSHTESGTVTTLDVDWTYDVHGTRVDRNATITGINENGVWRIHRWQWNYR